MKKARKTALASCVLIRDHDERYYRDARPVIGDREYDFFEDVSLRLERELDPLGLFKTEEASRDSEQKSLPQVGDDRLEAFASHRHLLPMLSLDNTYDEKEFFDFDQRLRKLFDLSDLPYVVEPKIDGVAVSLTYLNGALKTAATRGNGLEGASSRRTSGTWIHCPLTCLTWTCPKFWRYGVKST